MKKYKLAISFLFVTVVVLSSVRTIVANRISTDGVVLDKVSKEIALYKTENLIYKEKVLTLSSLNNISSQASRLGFVDSKTGFVVGKALPIAVR